MTQNYNAESSHAQTTVSDSIEVHKTFNGKIGLKLAVGWGDIKPIFGLDLAETNWSLVRKSDYTWKQTLIRQRARESHNHVHRNQ